MRHRKREKERGDHQWYGEGWWRCFTGVCSTVQGGSLYRPAPLNPSHLLRPWIRHTPVSLQPAAEFVLIPVMHVCPLFPAFSYPCFHPLFLSLSERQCYQLCLGQDGQTLFYSRHVFIHAPHLAFSRVSFTHRRKFYLPLPVLLASLTCCSFSYTLHLGTAFLSHDRLLPKLLNLS